MPQKKLFAALLVAASALLMLGMSNENQIPYDTADHLQDGYVVVPAEKFFYMWFDSHLFAAGDRKQQWLAAEPPVGTK